MHAVSPVHVYVENHVKKPVVATNIDETIKSLNKEKQKGKKVKIITSNLSRINQSKTNVNRSRSLSPKDKLSSKNKTPSKSKSPAKSILTNTRITQGRATKNKSNELNDSYDHIPEKDIPTYVRTISPVNDANAKSRSPSLKASVSYDALNISDYNSDHEKSNKNNNNNNKNNRDLSPISCTNSYCDAFKSKQNKVSHSMENLNNNTYTLEQNINSIPDTNFGREASLKSSLKLRGENPDLIVAKNSNASYDLLLDKLNDTETVGNDIAKQLSALKDFLKLICNENQINSLTTKKLENDRDALLKQMEIYENINQDLRNLLFDLKTLETNDYRRNMSNESLLRRMDGIQYENNNLKKLNLELEKTVMKVGAENEQYKLENSALANLRASLETNRAHLRKNLCMKESEFNRLKVQFKALERKQQKTLLELQSIKNSVGSVGLTATAQPNSARSNSAEKTTKLRLTEAQFKAIIQKLQTDLQEKENLVKELMEKNSDKKQENDINNQSEHSDIEMNSSRSVNLKLQQKDEKIRNLESEIFKLKKDLEESNTLLSKYREKRVEDEHDKTTLLQLAEDKENEVKRIKNFREMDLDKVRAKLQQRLNELEPLPELLKNTELKLHEAMKKQKESDSRIAEQARVINDLSNKIEFLEKDKNYTRGHVSIRHSESGDHADARLKNFEDENQDLFRQLQLKDEALREINIRLTAKSNEVTSLSRQLELAINDSKLKEDHIKDRFTSKERTLQSRCVELETYLSKLKIELNSLKRDKEEAEYRCQSQLKDLKDKLEQSYATNTSMQNYVNFLKNSYNAVFNDSGLCNASSTAMSTSTYSINKNSDFALKY